MPKTRQYNLMLASLVILAGVSTTKAQEVSGNIASPAGEPWTVHCNAASRTAQPDCRMEQRAVVIESGQLLMQVTIRVPADTRQPVMMLQAPFGPFLPAGIILDVDEADPLKLDFQTCDLQGCYAGGQVSEELLAAMFRGQHLNVAIQSLNKQPIKVPMSLIGFTAAYERIR